MSDQIDISGGVAPDHSLYWFVLCYLCDQTTGNRFANADDPVLLTELAEHIAAHSTSTPKTA